MSEELWTIPASWRWATAGEIAKIVGGGTPSSKLDGNFAENGIPWITPADLTGYGESHISRGRRDLSEQGFAGSGAQLIPAGSVLFSSRAPIGYCVIASNEVSTNQGFKSLVLDGEIDPGYIRHYLLSAKEYAESKASGTTFMELSGARVAELAVPIAPLPEQRRIVAKVDGLTARTARARKELNRIPTLIARYKQRLLALAFSGELTAGWRADHKLREPVPTTVDDLSEGLRYGTAQKSYAEPNGVAVLRIPNVASGRISLEDLKYSKLEPKEFAKLRLNEGDILVVRSNGSVDLVGRPALVTGDAVGLAYAGYLIRIRPKHDVVMPRFLTLMLEAPAIRSIIEAGARSTSGVNNVNATELGALTVPLFEIDEQAEIVRRIESAFGWLDRMATDHAAAARLLPKLDAAILAKAFRGKLVPQDPNDEPAAKLLERIKAEREAEGTKPKSGRGRKPNGSKAQGMTEKTLAPRDRLLKDSEGWPVVGLPFEAIAMRNAMPHDTLRDALFELLSGPSSALQQRFDTDAEVIVIQRVAA